MEAEDYAAVGSVLGVVLLFIVLGVLFLKARKTQRQRTRALAHWARQHGWAFVPSGGRVTNPLDGSTTRGQILSGPYRGHEIYATEFTVGSGESRSLLHVVQIRTPAPRPALEVKKERIEHKFVSALGWRDLTLSDPQFNKSFWVRTDSEEFAQHVMHPGLMHWMLHTPKAQESPIRFQGDSLLTWTRNRTLEPHDILAEADFLIQILDQVPASVWSGAPPPR